MARLKRKGHPTRLVVDDDGARMPVVPAGNLTLHNLTPTESVADRNSSAFDSECGLVLVFVTGRAHFKLGGSSVTATASDQYIPAGVWLPVPLFEGDGANADYISIISASGSGDIAAQIAEAV